MGENIVCKQLKKKKKLIESQQNSIGSTKMYKKKVDDRIFKRRHETKTNVECNSLGEIEEIFWKWEKQKANESECANERVRKIKIT